MTDRTAEARQERARVRAPQLSVLGQQKSYGDRAARGIPGELSE